MGVNLPGIGDTVIKQAVPPGGDLCIALGQVEACDLPKRGRLGCAIFGSGGLRSRVPRNMIIFLKKSKVQGSSTNLDAPNVSFPLLHHPVPSVSHVIFTSIRRKRK